MKHIVPKPKPVLYASLAEPAGHVALAVRRLRGLDVPQVVLRARRDGPPAAEDTVLPWEEEVAPAVALWDAEANELVSDEPHLVVAALDGRPAAVDPISHGSEDGRRARTLSRALLDAAQIAATTQDQVEYEAAYASYFGALEALDRELGQARFLAGDEPGLSDLWLFAILLRHDPAYYPFYKLNRRRLDDFAHLGEYTRDLFQRPGWSDLVDLREIRRFYAWKDELKNPKRRVPTGGLVDLWRPHDRHTRFGTRPPSDAGTQESQAQLTGPGAWVRGTSAHRGWVGGEHHPLEAGRYHLYVANNCPWCHRVVLGRAVLGLEDAVSMDVLFYRRDPERGWQFRPSEPGCTADTVHGFDFVKQVYEREGSADKSVPVLYDKVAGRIVSNESADILRMFSTVFTEIAPRPMDLYPEAHRAEIDQLNAWIYHRINNGAYKAGFSASQQVHEAAADALFEALEGLERRLEGRRFLVGDALTEADLRLFPTIFRFDHVYFTRFLLNRRRISDHPNLSGWRSRVLDVPGVREASNLEHCKRGYFGRTGDALVPVGPELEF